MNYVKINPKLFVFEKVIAGKAKPVPAVTNHIWEIDRSGSMSYLLPQLVADLKKKARELRAGDTLSVGWFSGEGQRNFVLKGFRVHGDADLRTLDTVFDNMVRTVGTTCFSEILADTKQVVADVSVFSNRYAFMLFTDGYPVVSNYAKEITAIQAAVDALRADLTSSLVVGYGDYYNKELLVDVSRRLGGALIHSSALPHFSIALDSFMRDTAGISRRIEVPVSEFDPQSTFFTIQGSQIVNLEAREGKVQLPASATDETRLYVVTTKAPVLAAKDEVKLTQRSIRNPADRAAGLVEATYAAALLLTQSLRTDVALEFLGALGDKRLIDAVNNAFTNAEYGIAEDRIRQAIEKPHARLVQGYDANYVPPADAYCLLDFLEDMRTASFFPGSKGFEYKRTGAATKTKDGYGKFEYELGAKVPMADFVWNQTRLNLSLLARIPGLVELQPRDGKSAKDFGLLEHYPAFVFRNFTLVKDGVLNVTKLVATIPSQQMFDKLNGLGMLESGGYVPFTWMPTIGYTIDLTKIPVMNRATADGRTSAAQLAKNIWRELELQGKIKALKSMLPTREEKEAKAVSKGPAIDFVVANGINVEKGGLYQPETEVEKTEDFYMAKSFDIGVKGCSSLPKVADVQKAEDAKKALTKAQQLVAAGLQLAKKEGVAKMKPAVATAWAEDKIKELQAELRDVRTDIQKTKFAVILGKRWFDDLKTRDNPVLIVGDNEFTFKLGEEKVGY